MPYTLQDVVDAGFAPSVRWLATGIKQGTIPGRMIGRYWKNWRMTDADLVEFLEGTKAPAKPRDPDPPPLSTEPAGALEPDARAALISGLSPRTRNHVRGYRDT